MPPRPLSTVRAWCRRPLVQDTGLAAALVALTIAMYVPSPDPVLLGVDRAQPVGSGLWFTASAAACVAMALRRRFPYPMLVLAVTSAVVHMGQGAPGTAVDLAAPILVGTIAAMRSRRASVAVLGLVLLTATAAGITVSYTGEPGRKLPDVIWMFTYVEPADAPVPDPPDTPPGPTGPPRFEVKHPADMESGSEPNAWGGFPVLGSVLFAAWAIGSRARTRRAYLDELTARARDLERERDQRAALAVAAERGRISRELHDVVAHGLSVMVVQAQGGAAALDRRPEDTRTALAAIVDTGRRALADMRRALAAVGAEGAEGGAWEPPPGLARLPQLIERLGAAGTPVALRVEGTPVAVPSAVELSAYRIVQEALTNVVKHAGPDASARVLLAYEPDRVRVEVADDGTGPATMDGGGNGLRGMRERVGLLGGSLRAGPNADGGFTVRAELPLEGTGT